MYCVITRLELMELRRIVDQFDGSAFITVSDISEIIGEHMKKCASAEKNGNADERRSNGACRISQRL